MSIAKCERGHFYDNNRFSACPFCGDGAELLQTVSMKASPNYASDADDVTVAKSPYDDEVTVSKNSALEEDEKTVGMFKMKINCEPIVGWLVCRSGKEKGRDYKLHSGRNFVGRSAKMGVAIFDDTSISRQNHLSIIYDPKSNGFIIVSGENETFVNGAPLQGDSPLTEGDVIQIGDSELVFIPYCKGERRWDK